MIIQENISLKSYNTFGIEAKGRYFIEISSLDDLSKALELKGYPEIFVLSGGSNMLLTRDLERLVLFINLKGISVSEENDSEIVLQVMAGENWHDLVLWTLDKGYGGLQNLALIPGNTGTAPIQNIGAYGVELKDVFEGCEAVDIRTGKRQYFSREQCRFGYRDSFFKREGKGKFIITSVDLRLSKKNHKINIEYAPLKAELSKKGIQTPDIVDIADAVIAVRSSKLPDPGELGNSGSFFKNPVIHEDQFQIIKDRFPEIPSYDLGNHNYKIPAAWLIDQCGLKGKRFGDAGVHKNQALVLVNYGSASGTDILNLARRVQSEVKEKFGISLEPEVNIIS
ncbi:UDP-N-acetylmuramate dehydrogenase [Lentiprolixibacter aurantiacus]|uniref:UDP-N-acetylenolpyruvoylglucosamine reductase n=1 Tax=Lentiprolixibacter aurantiacus TaxID=2993939 RepID=A0AAE3MLU0_9FLAO|nr:UDP-N-acetylmuramate dehydrogenase [Lentiprolixibacter aurantiacus]